MIKKVQRNHIQHDNPEIECGNTNAQTHTEIHRKCMQQRNFLLIPCDNKCAVKVEINRNPLALVPKSKVGWIGKLVEAKTANRDTVLSRMLHLTQCL